MKICIVGAGNIGLAMASELSVLREYEVCVYTKRKFDISQFVFCDIENDKKYSDLTFKIEENLELAISDAEIIFCTYPAFLRPDFVNSIEEYIKPGCKLGFVPGYGGAEYCCRKLIQKGIIVFGLQRVPFVARQEQKKKSILLSRKTMLYLAALPQRYTEEVSKLVEKLLRIPTVPLKEYLAVTLAPSNPLLHLSGIYTVFKDWEPGEFYKKQLMFYEEWTDETSEILLKYDNELQEICCKMKPLDLNEVVSLKLYYESETVQAMTKKLKSIKAFEVVKVPLIKTEDKYFPDFNSRMFTEDFPYGIAIIKYFAILLDVKTPIIDKILGFYREKTGICYYNDNNSFGKDINQTGVPYNYGFTSFDEIVRFYKQ